MRKELAEIARIERYLMNQLNDQDKKRFEDDLSRDVELAEKVNFQRDLVFVIKRLGLKKKAQKAQSNYKLLKLSKLIGSIFALAGAVAFAVFYFSNQSESIEPIDNTVVYNQPIQLSKNDSLSSIANQYLDQEVFRIKTTEDTVVETADGIVVFVPEGAFDSDAEEIDLMLQAAVQPSDILMAGLSTLSDGSPLETGGMFYIDAFEEGRRVGLKKNLTVDVPTQEELTGMQVYEGQKTADGEINWVKPKPVERYLIPVDIQTLDFYPPGYETALDNWGLYGKAFRDSLYLSFAFSNDPTNRCQNRLDECGVPDRKLTPEERDFIYDDNRPIDKKMTREEALILCENDKLTGSFNCYGGDPAVGEKLFNGNCASCHFPDRDMTGPALKGARERWMNYSTEENFYAWIKNSQEVIKSGDKYANRLYLDWGRVVMTPQAITNEQIDHIFAYVETFGSYTSSWDPERVIVEEGEEDILLDSVGHDDIYYDMETEQAATPSQMGVDPAAVMQVWTSGFNQTNLATREFEERMAWIHQSCETEVLLKYIRNSDKPLYYTDSIVALATSGEVGVQFNQFYKQKDGSIDDLTEGGLALYAYFEKKRKARADAVLAAQKDYWDQQERKDAYAEEAKNTSESRNKLSERETFKKEVDANLKKAYQELGINPGAPAENRSSYTVSVSTLGWKNIDRKVRGITAGRETNEIAYQEESVKFTYEDWSATVFNSEQYDRVNLYNIPKQLNSYVKLKPKASKYSYKLNTDFHYQTLVLAWTEDQLFFYQDKKTEPGVYEIALKPISHDAFKYNVAAALSSIKHMDNEMEYIANAQKDQKRVNTNKKKVLLRSKAERVIFKCRYGESFPIGAHGNSEHESSGEDELDFETSAQPIIYGDNIVLTFEETPIKEVIEKLEKAYNAGIMTDPDLNEEMLFSGSFDNEKLKVVLEAICLTLDLEYRYNEELDLYYIRPLETEASAH